MNFRNENLHSVMRAYVIAAVDFIAERARQESPSADPESNFDFHWTHARYSSDLSEIPAYEACLKELISDEVISKHLDANVGSYSRGTRTPSAEQMMRHVIDLGRGDAQYVFDAERFEREYHFFEETFYSEGLLCEAIAPLQGLLLETPVVHLSDGLEIKRLQEEEMKPYRTPGARWDSRWCAVRVRYLLPKVIGAKESNDRWEKMEGERAIEERANERVEDVVNALRLFGKCDVYHSGILHESSKWLFIHSHSTPNRALGSGIVSYALNDSEANSFAALWKRLDDPVVKKNLGTAVRRFSYSCVRHLNEDKIIDLMIAAEALFLHGSKEGEKRFRVALLAGLFLGTDPANQKEVFYQIRRAYDIRSTLVHGESFNLKPKDGSVEEFIGKTGDHIQSAIFKALNLLADSKTIKNLDNEYWNSLMFK